MLDSKTRAPWADEGNDLDLVYSMYQELCQPPTSTFLNPGLLTKAIYIMLNSWEWDLQWSCDLFYSFPA